MENLRTLNQMNSLHMPSNSFVSKLLLRLEIEKWIRHLGEQDYFEHLNEPYRSYEIMKIQGKIAILEQIFNIKYEKESKEDN